MLQTLVSRNPHPGLVLIRSLNNCHLCTSTMLQDCKLDSEAILYCIVNQNEKFSASVPPGPALKK